jgi:hypothetical protein
MKRAIVLALSVILALVVAAPTVLAQEEGPPNGGAPEVVPEDPFVLPAKNPTAPDNDPASLGCDFPLLYEPSGKGKAIELPDGGFILTSPGLYVTLTNVETPENQVTYNVTGSIHGTPRSDDPNIVDYVITGRNLASDPAGVFLNIGRFTYTLRYENNQVIEIVKPQEGTGQAIDVCELLS